MRSWEGRGDTFVCDEPLYANYLRCTGLPHPGADEIIAHHESDWRAVVEWLTGPVPEDRPIFYQKHMAHHLLSDIDTAWLDRLENCFLIREPREMITSLDKVTPHPTLDGTGLPQQVAIFEQVRQSSGRVPPVLDARDVLADPPGMLAKLCEAVGVPFTDRMLEWATGPRPTDGVWAKHWYDAVEQSTGFKPYRPKDESVPDELLDLLSQCERLYATLYDHRVI
jgi:hypothetical protein